MLPRTKYFKPRHKRVRKIYIALGVLALAIATSQFGPTILNKVKESYNAKLDNLLKKRGCYRMGIKDGRPYASFRGHDIGFKKGLEGSGLNKILYELNQEKNPGLDIKGDNLARLKDLFALVGNNPIAKEALEGRVTYCPEKEYCNNPLKDPASLLASKDYWYPYYKN